MFGKIKEVFSGELIKSCHIFETNDKGHGRIEKESITLTRSKLVFRIEGMGAPQGILQGRRKCRIKIFHLLNC